MPQAFAMFVTKSSIEISRREDRPRLLREDLHGGRHDDDVQAEGIVPSETVCLLKGLVTMIPTATL